MGILYYPTPGHDAGPPDAWWPQWDTARPGVRRPQPDEWTDPIDPVLEVYVDNLPVEPPEPGRPWLSRSWLKTRHDWPPDQKTLTHRRNANPDVEPTWEH